MAIGKDQRNSYLVCLTNRDFLLFWSGQYISFIGDRLAQLAFGVLLGIAVGASVQNDPEAATKVNTLFFVSIIPYIFMFPISGYLVDRFRRRNVMIVCTCLQGVVAVAMAEIIRAQGFDAVADAVVYLGALLIYTNSAVFNPAKYALIPELIDEEHLLAANALNTSTATISTLLGTYLGGWMLETLRRATGDNAAGVIWALYLDSITFFLPGLMLALIVSDLHRRPHHQIDARMSSWQRVIEGFHYLSRHVAARRLLAVVFLTWFIGGFFLAAVNVLVIKVRGEPMGTYTLWMGNIGVGIFGGAILTGFTCRHVRPKVVIGTALPLVGLLLLFSSVFLARERAQMPYLILAAMAAGGAIVTMDTTMQRIVPNSIRGRIFAISFLVVNVATATAFLLNILLEKGQAREAIARLLPGIAVTESAYFQLLGLIALGGGLSVWWLGGSPMARGAQRRRVDRSQN